MFKKQFDPGPFNLFDPGPFNFTLLYTIEVVKNPERTPMMLQYLNNWGQSKINPNFNFILTPIFSKINKLKIHIYSKFTIFTNWRWYC